MTLIDYMQIVEITSLSQKSYFPFTFLRILPRVQIATVLSLYRDEQCHLVRSCRNQTNMLQRREVYLVHLRDANAETCMHISRRASMYFLCLPRARFNDNIALCDRKRVRNSYARVGTHGGDKYSIFRSYWLRILPRAQIAAVPPLYRDEQCRYHQNSLPGAQMHTIERRKRREN